MEEQQLPIDVTFSKLADWLVDRKRMISTLLSPVLLQKTMCIKALEKLTDIGYLEAKHVLDVLTAARPEARTLFGRLSGIAGDWDTIVRAYEKDYLFLGESSQVMLQTVSYDIPYFKKQIAKFQQQLADVERKESEYKRSAAAAAIKYKQACQELGINGTNVKAELIATTNNLPRVFTEVEEVLCNELMSQTVNCYEDFVSYANKESDKFNAVVPNLKKLQHEHSNPIHVENLGSEVDEACPSPSAMVADMNISTLENMKSTSSSSAHVDWDIETGADSERPLQEKCVGVEGNGEQPVGVDTEPGSVNKGDPFSSFLQGGIDWDTGDVGDSGDVASETQWDIQHNEQFDTGPSEIQWDISIEDIADLLEVVPSVCLNGDVGQSAQTPAVIPSEFLESEFRNSLLNDLLEIKAFLALRAEEMKREESSSLQNQVQAVSPQHLQQYDRQSEEANSTILDLLKCYASEHEWKEQEIPAHFAAKDKTFEGDKYVQNVDEAYKKVKIALEKTLSKQKKAVDRHRHELVFSLGDWVLLRFEKISDVAYRLKLQEGWKIYIDFHVSLLRPFVDDVLETLVPEEQLEVEKLDEIVVPEQISALVEKKVRGKGGRRYLVKVKNYSPMDAE
ncbi:hypothetical protein L7F22_028659 [Adiantum nelumboides]|nr:hypothetical protein [Adiantum nelumboides]